MTKTLLEFYNSLPRVSTINRDQAAPGIEVDVDIESMDKFILHCQTTEPAISGNRDTTLYKLAAYGRDLAIPRTKLFCTIRDEYNPRLAVPVQDQDIWKVVDNAEKHAKGNKGAALPAAKFQDFAPELAAVQIDATPAPVDCPDAESAPDAVSSAELRNTRISKAFIPTDPQMENDRVKNSLSNMLYYLSKEWGEAFRLNDFSGRIEFVAKPFWREDNHSVSNDLSKEDATLMRAWYSRNHNLEASRENVWVANFTLAVTQRYHPVKDWLYAIVWDGVPRLDNMLIDTMGAYDANDGYIQEVSKNVVLSACMRIVKPGCKQDHVMVVEGKQGIEKSKWIEVFGGPHSAVGALVQGNKDNYICLKGKWIVELPEINATFTKQHFAWLKGIISTASDTYRPLYAESAETVPRESIFIATLNPNATDQYLKDDENRRYWPVKARKLNLELLRKNRDQYFAEAMHRLHDTNKAGPEHPLGEAWWITDPKLVLAAKNAQDSRRDKDAWLELLEPWLQVREESGFSSHDIWGALGKNTGDIKSYDRSRLYAVMQDAGWTYERRIGSAGRWVRFIDWEALR